MMASACCAASKIHARRYGRLNAFRSAADRAGGARNEDGAADVLTRPINTEHLVRAVLEALRQDVHVGAVEGGGWPVEVRGQSIKEAGRELGISPRTVEVHRARVMEKLGARNTADLMRIVLTW
jgi:FixJ family two-component response regulator